MMDFRDMIRILQNIGMTFPPEFVLKFDQNDIATLNQCVGELPFKIAQPFVTKMNVQMAPQLKPKTN